MTPPSNSYSAKKSSRNMEKFDLQMSTSQSNKDETGSAQMSNQNKNDRTNTFTGYQDMLNKTTVGGSMV